MATRRSPRKHAAKKASEVIEIPSSDSEPEAPVVERESPEPAPETTDNDQPLLRAAGIKYKTNQPEDEEPREDQPDSPSGSKLAVRTRSAVSAKFRRVDIEIPLLTSSELRRRAESSAPGSQQENDGEVFKTPNERKHITFDDSENDEFVTPGEGPARNPLETSLPEPAKDDEEEEDQEEADEDSDDEAPPEVVSTRAAEAETVKAAKAAAKAAEQQAAALKRKRQERDALLRRQAEERKQSRKAARQDAEDGEGSPDAQEPMAEPEKRKRETPKLLPLEFLESDDEDSDPQQRSPAVDGKHKRRRLGGAEHALLREPKHPKDRRVGSTAYRVVKPTGDARLAPKVKKQAVSLKEMLLRRDRAPQPRGGFFVRNR